MIVRVAMIFLLLATSCSKVNFKNALLIYSVTNVENDVEFEKEKYGHVILNCNDTIYGNFLKPVKIDSTFNSAFPKFWFEHVSKYRYVPFSLIVTLDTIFALVRTKDGDPIKTPYFLNTSTDTLDIPSLGFFGRDTSFFSYLVSTSYYTGTDTTILLNGKKFYCKIYKGHNYLPDDSYLTYYLDAKSYLPLKIIDSFYLGTHTSWDYENKYVFTYELSKVSKY